jgi:hypothetical protein
MGGEGEEPRSAAEQALPALGKTEEPALYEHSRMILVMRAGRRVAELCAELTYSIPARLLRRVTLGWIPPAVPVLFPAAKFHLIEFVRPDVLSQFSHGLPLKSCARESNSQSS